MTKYCEACEKEFARDIKRCPDCAAKLQKKYTAEELEEMRKQEEEAALIAVTVATTFM